MEQSPQTPADQHPIEEQASIQQGQEDQKAEHHYSDVKTLLSWSAPGRPFQKRGREFFVSLILITIFLEIILFLFSQYQLMLAVLSVAFLTVVLSTVAPRNFHYKITSEGIQVEDLFYIWSELYDFYFKKINGAQTLIVRTHSLVPGELHIPFGENTEEQLRKMLVVYIPFREVVKSTFMEKSADWLARTFPLDRVHHQ